MNLNSSKIKAGPKPLGFLRSVLLVVLLCFTAAGCGGSDDGGGSFDITGVNLPSAINGKAGDDIVLTGRGFAAGDRIKFVSSLNPSDTYVSAVSVPNSAQFRFALPDGIATGEYMLYVVRGAASKSLGMIMINVIAAELPDVGGKNVKGVVSCDGAGVKGVVVSDGYEVTVTDSEGVYYLASTKKSGFVFISVPSNYEVPNSGVFPQFFKRLSRGASVVEQKDFELARVNNDYHEIYTLADLHLANRNDDLKQFENFVSEIKSYIGSNGNKRIYGLTLGDMTWDQYWESRNYGLGEYVRTMNTSGIQGAVFHVMGNHDNNPYCYGDWAGEQMYKDVIGPTYYSFNLGKIHYVVLDDMEYVNNGGAAGIVGDRSYNGVIVADQMKWLAKDLEHVDAGTPLVVSMHVQVHKHPTTLDAQGNQIDSRNIKNADELLSLLSRFRNVHILTGHTHIKYNVEAADNIQEHNIAAVCATWWWTGKTGYAGNHICKDGAPGGYEVFRMNGDDIKWYYKGIGESKEYQFRTYDLNRCHITAEKYAPKADDSHVSMVGTYAGAYINARSDNEVLVNVWGYDSKWKVEVTENGRPLDVKRVVGLDPLHIISYEMLRLNANASPTSSFVSCKTSHLFKVKASSAESTLEIKVTDRFGNVYTESMNRPKALAVSMK